MTGWGGRIVVLALAPMLTGCETTMDLLDRRAGNTDILLQITRDGLGPLSGATPYDQAAILKAMPGYTAGSILIGLESDAVSALVLFHQGEGGTIQTVQIVPSADGTRIGQIHGVSQQVSGPAGERPGMVFSATKTDPATCRMGTALWAGLAVCRSAGADNVTLTFSFKGDYGRATTVPPPDQLAAGELQRIIWSPPG